MSKILELKEISVHFGGLHALSSFSLDVDAGESVGLIGPNGAGKSTALRAMSGELKLANGQIRFAGLEVTHWPAHRRAQAGMARTFQVLELFSDLSVEDHLLVALRAREQRHEVLRDLSGRSGPTPEEAAAMDRTLKLVGISRWRSEPVGRLPLGICRLVELARAVVTGPSLLLADEPSSGLDDHEVAEAMEVLRRIRAEDGTAMILVEHNLEFIEAMCTKVVVMDLGKLLAEGSFAEISANQAVRTAYFGANA